MIQKVKQHLTIARLFVNQFFDENTKEEERTLKQWQHDHQDATQQISNWDNFTQRQLSVSEIDTDKEWRKLGEKLQKPSIIPLFVKYAAAAVIVLAAGMLLYVSQYQPREVVQVQRVVKENPKGVKSQIQLPDGTRVWLNSASSIAYLSHFSESERIVELQGEGYFEVVKDASRPFRVRSAGVTTTALGTAFNVNAYDSDQVVVSLHEGKVDVKLANGKGSAVLLPGQQVRLENEKFAVVEFKSEGVLAWKNGIIYFDNTDFEQVLSTLEKWYDVSLVVQNLPDAKRRELKVTGTFKEQTLANVLKLLSHSMQFDYTIKEKDVTLKFR